MTTARPLLIASDVDGCLLDEQTYSYECAREAVEALRGSGTPLILSSSKTRAEMEVLVAELSLPWPYIVENGGALVIPLGQLASAPAAARVDGGVWVVDLGVAREMLVRHLEEIAAETGVRVRGFSALSASDVSALTGLGRVLAERALRRAYDEPFLLEGPEAPITAAALARGLRVTRGARFLHLTGPVDKGSALAELLRLFEKDGQTFRTVAIGDAPNDLPMLRAADRPILIPRGRGVDPELARALPRAERAPLPGPAGWACAVLTVTAGGRLPSVGRPRPVRQAL